MIEPKYEEIARLFETQGHSAYFGEAVSQTEHALQAADLAEREGASPALIVAALLHDVGHLLGESDIDPADHGQDGQHEELGVAWLNRSFGPEVTEPIRLHVVAKRYLCRVEPGYFDDLSPASKRSLTLQGGIFSAEEAKAFESNPHFEAAIRLRHWDDEAKVPGLVVPGVEHYRDRIEATRLNP
ncbi:phosphonate degradation HD-domain oxygenase [Singulisphaera sp. PoT]|uniref:phosphonate degradation HD-domain oxygenase n=1 Tax=Singulisphaera sp. PoT TaxID=3411797 RepID=UPI003BF513D2